MDAPSTSPRLSTAEMLARLVSFDTTSRNSNLALIGFVRDYLDAHGIPYRISTDPTGEKANIHAIIGPQAAGGVALSGHVDTVPVDGQAWSADPFTLRRADGRLYARGSADMKGFVVRLPGRGARCQGAQARAAAAPVHQLRRGSRLPRREAADRGPGRLRPEAGAVRGGRTVGHAADPGAQGQAEPARARARHAGSFQRTRQGRQRDPGRGRGASPMSRRRRVGWPKEGPFEDGFDPPHTTIHVGTMQGGTILNIIPERCEFIMEWRTIPGRRRRTAMSNACGSSSRRTSSRRCMR